MASLLITKNKAECDWAVWIGLEDHDPVLDTYGFAIGVGSTRDAAVAMAVKVLETAVEQLQAPIGVVRERRIR